MDKVLGWPKSSFEFFQKMLQQNLNELFGQSYIFIFVTALEKVKVFLCDDCHFLGNIKAKVTCFK